MGLFRSTVLLIALTAVLPAGDLKTWAVAVERGDFAVAAGELKVYIGHNPSSTAARILLARAYMGLNRGLEALNELQEVLRLEPDSVEALYYTSKLAGVLSRQQFVAVARLAPDSARAHQIEGDALEALSDVDGARREYLTALRKRPGTAYIMNALGDLDRHIRQYDAALSWYEKVLERDPDNYDALYGAGACYYLKRVPEKAQPFFRRALATEPSSLAAKFALGETLLLTGSAAEALRLFEDVAKAENPPRRLYHLLARAYRSLGRTEEGRRALARFKELSNTYPEAPNLGWEDQ